MPKGITIKDIAREAGVSITLVSFVMNDRVDADGKHRYRVSESTRAKVLEVARRLNYQPNNAARSLRQGRSRVIGVILPDLSNIFYGKIVRMLEEITFRNGYTVLFGSSGEDPGKFASLVKSFMEKDVEGFIVVPVEGSLQTMIFLRNTGIPVVVIDRRYKGFRIPTVLTDNDKAMQQALAVLMDTGVRKIGMVSYAMRISSMSDREKSFMRTLSARGVEKPEHYIWRLSFDGESLDAAKVADELIAEGIEGLVIASNKLAVAIVRELRQKGVRIQKDIRLVCFDYSNIYGLFTPPIPYLEQPLEEITSEAAKYLFRLIDGKALGEDISSDAEMIVLSGTLHQ